MEEYKLTTKKRFENFLENNPKYLATIAGSILKKQELDFSEDEVKQVSQYYIDCNNNNQFDEFEYWHFYTYYGHAMIRKYGQGEWKYSLVKDDAFQAPILIKHKKYGVRFYPYEWIIEAFKNRNPNQFNEDYHLMKEMEEKTNQIFSELLAKSPKKK